MNKKQATFNVFANINLATHFLDFGVINHDNNYFELSAKGYENLCDISSSPLDSGIEWYEEGTSTELDTRRITTADYVAKKRSLALELFPEDLQDKVKEFLVANPWANQFPLSPICRYGRELVVYEPHRVMEGLDHVWFSKIMNESGYGAAEKIQTRMAVLHPVVWEKIDARCLEKGKTGEQYRSMQNSYLMVRVFVYEQSFWITTYSPLEGGWYLAYPIGNPDYNARKCFSPEQTFNYKF